MRNFQQSSHPCTAATLRFDSSKGVTMSIKKMMREAAPAAMAVMVPRKSMNFSEAVVKIKREKKLAATIFLSPNFADLSGLYSLAESSGENSLSNGF
jgi:hypothetical protein